MVNDDCAKHRPSPLTPRHLMTLTDGAYQGEYTFEDYVKHFNFEVNNDFRYVKTPWLHENVFFSYSIFLTLTMPNFLNEIILLTFLALSIIIFRDIKMKT